jgi:hypothetical protein
MELSDAWGPDITKEEIEEDGILLDEIRSPHPDKKDFELVYKLYYLKSKGVFATLDEHGYYNVVTSDETIQSYRHTYLKQGIKPPVKDAFVEADDTGYTSFQSEITATYIKKYGRFLEHVHDADIYYLEEFDVFLTFNVDTGIHSRVVDDKHLFRKKYNIPFQDERFQNLY